MQNHNKILHTAAIILYKALFNLADNLSIALELENQLKPAGKNQNDAKYLLRTLQKIDLKNTLQKLNFSLGSVSK